MSKLIYLNPGDRPNPKYRWDRKTKLVLWAGPAYSCSTPNHFVYFGSLDDALDEVIDWLAKNAPGVLCDNEVNEAYQAYIEEHKGEYEDGENDEDLQEEARCEAEVDCTTGGNCANYIMSDSWGIAFENPTREQIKELIGRMTEGVEVL